MQIIAIKRYRNGGILPSTIRKNNIQNSDPFLVQSSLQLRNTI